jgi:DNA-binding transcriptional LysR family regulator
MKLKNADGNGSRKAMHDQFLDLDLLKALITINDTKSFTLAAERLGCTQAAVSQQIQRLEAAVGFALVKRSKKILQLTGEGELLLEHGRRMLALNEEALASLRSASLFGTVRIGAMDNYAVRILPPLLAMFSEQHPEVRIEILTGLTHSLEGMLGREIDLLIAPELSPSGYLLKTERTVWVYGGSEAIQARDPVPLALLSQGSFFRDVALKALEQAQVNWHPAYVCSNMSTMTALIAAGRAIGVCPSSLVGGKLKLLNRGKRFPALPDVHITLRASGKNMSTATRALRKFLIEHAAH